MTLSTCLLCERDDALRDWGNAVYCRRCNLFASPGSEDAVTEGASFNDACWHRELPGPDIYEDPQADAAHQRYAGEVEALTGRAPLSVLDVGCGLGVFLASVSRRGWKARGLEPSEAAATFARKHLPVEIVQGTLATYHPPLSTTFDILRMHHVLEHQMDPLDALRRARLLLKPDGFLCVGVPNAHATVNRIRNLARGVLGRRQGRLSCDVDPRMGHLFGFTRRSLKTLIEKAGFEVVVIHEVQRGHPIYLPYGPRFYRSLGTWQRVLYLLDTLAARWGGSPAALQAFASPR